MLLATVAALATAPCMAQEAADASANRDARNSRDTPAAPAGEPRSAFGRVMSLLLAELERNAENPGATPATGEPMHARASTRQPADQHQPVQHIEVGAKFRLGAPPLASEREPLADSSTSLD